MRSGRLRRISPRFSVSLLSSILVVLTYRFGSAARGVQRNAVASALILAFATIMFPYATEFAGEPIAALSCSRPSICSHGPIRAPRLVAVGRRTARGMSVVCDYPTFFWLPG